jgi:hypothetical protein
MDGAFGKHLFECLATLQNMRLKQLTAHDCWSWPLCQDFADLGLRQLIRTLWSLTHLAPHAPKHQSKRCMKAGVALNPHTSVDHLKTRLRILT